MKPSNPVDYKDTEFLQSFYLACYSDKKQLIKFTKYLIDIESVGEKLLYTAKLPSSRIYFSDLDLTNLHVTLETAIEYKDTKNFHSYYMGIVADTGETVRLNKIRRRIFFVDNYTYWDDSTDRLKERVMEKEEGTIIKFIYDQKGNKIDETKFFIGKHN